MSPKEYPREYTLDPDGDLFLILTVEVEHSKSDICMDDENDTSQKETHDLSHILTNKVEDGSSDSTCKDDENDTSQRGIRVKCSSKHLSLASSVFKAMLSETSNEGAVFRSTGVLRLPLPEDNRAAFLLLLNIIHGQTEETPLEVDLCMLTRIAIIVDRYRLHMAVKIFSRIWIGRLEVKKFRDSMEDINRWIFISWVFQWPTAFKIATQMAELTTESRIDESGEIDLPIPCSIVDAIDQHRQRALSELRTALYSIVEKYQGPVLNCTLRCDAIVLGTLTKTMKSKQLPEPPYSKLSFDSFAKKVEEMNILTDCDRESYGSYYYGESIRRPSSCPNRVKDEIQDLIGKIKGGLCGLGLDIVDSKRFD